MISFFYTLFLASQLGVENFGLYIAALSYYSLVTSFSDFGISRYLMREVAKEEQDSATLVSHIVFLRLTTLSVIFALFSLVIYFFDPSKMRVVLSLIAVLAVVPQSVALTFDNVFIALQKMSLSALGVILLSIANTILGVVLILQGKGALGAAMALLIAQIIYVVCLLMLLNHQKIKITTKLKFSLLSEIVKGSLPYGVLGILGLIYFKIDSLLLSYIKGSYDTGIYGISYKFLEAIVFVPTVVGIAFFPMLAKLHEVSSPEVKKVCRQIFKSMSAVGLLTLVVYLLVLPLIIKTFLPQYLASINAIKILSLSIPFMFIHIPLSQVLLSSDKYLKGVIALSVGNVLFNIILNLIFIPGFGYLGASWVTVASDIFSLVVLTFFIKRYLFNE